MDFSSVRYTLSDHSSKYPGGNYYSSEICDNSSVPYPKYGVNSGTQGTSVRQFEHYNGELTEAGYQTTLEKAASGHCEENLEGTGKGPQDMRLHDAHSSLGHAGHGQASRLVPDDIKAMTTGGGSCVSNAVLASGKYVDAPVARTDMSQEPEDTNYIVKLEKMSPDPGGKDTAKTSTTAEKKKTGVQLNKTQTVYVFM